MMAPLVSREGTRRRAVIPGGKAAGGGVFSKKPASGPVVQ